MRTQITLYGEDSEWFEEIRRQVAARRDGNPPSNAELLRKMMEAYTVEAPADSQKL